MHRSSEQLYFSFAGSSIGTAHLENVAGCPAGVAEGVVHGVMPHFDKTSAGVGACAFTSSGELTLPLMEEVTAGHLYRSAAAG